MLERNASSKERKSGELPDTALRRLLRKEKSTSSCRRPCIVENFEPTSLVNSGFLFRKGTAPTLADFNLNYRKTDRRVSLVCGQGSAGSQAPRAALGGPCKVGGLRPFLLYSLRHTFLTRLGESGCDAWTLARVAGHSSVSISSRYVHPSEDAVFAAVSRLGGHNNGHSPNRDVWEMRALQMYFPRNQKDTW